MSLNMEKVQRKQKALKLVPKNLQGNVMEFIHRIRYNMEK